MEQVISKSTETGVSPTIPTAVLMQYKIGLHANPEKILNITVDYMLQDEG